MEFKYLEEKDMNLIFTYLDTCKVNTNNALPKQGVNYLSNTYQSISYSDIRKEKANYLSEYIIGEYNHEMKFFMAASSCRLGFIIEAVFIMEGFEDEFSKSRASLNKLLKNNGFNECKNIYMSDSVESNYNYRDIISKIGFEKNDKYEANSDNRSYAYKMCLYK